MINPAGEETATGTTSPTTHKPHTRKQTQKPQKMNNETQTPARSVDFYENGERCFEYTNPDGEISYGKITPLANGNARFDWDEDAPEDWEDAEPFILAELDKHPPRPTDLTDYLETHYEISTYLALTEDSPGTLAQVTRENRGIGGLYVLAKALTDEFTERHAGTLWGCDDNTDYFDTLAEFMREKESTPTHRHVGKNSPIDRHKK